MIDPETQPGEPKRVPIVAVTGTNGKTTTARMIAHVVQATGRVVGLTTSDGSYVGGVRIASGDMAGPRSAREMLDDPRVEVAVLETARGGILRAGLAFDHSDVGVVTNVAADHLGLKGVETLADLARVKARVAAAVAPNGTCVLNAENPWTAAMARETAGAVFFFALDERNPTVRVHVEAGGRAIVLRQTGEREAITLLDGDAAAEIVPADEIPATLGGRAQANVANALAAAGAAIGLGIGPAAIGAALRGFAGGFGQTPGRFNYATVDGRQVLLDYAHNPHGLAEVAEFVRRTGAPSSVGVIGIAGDRRDEDIRAFGELAGRTFTRVVVREHDDLRGRAPGEAAGLLRAAVLAAGLPQDRVAEVLDETEAIHAALDWSAPGDLVIVLAYHPEQAWETLARRAGFAEPAEPAA